ncbi:unnamed protein product [Cyberlindnera jadinii]|uniref:Uncharacterized protein n=1 Tax=Cyberlindnera jadinii (strain ATCC 18201 / CBS 1600 / BCRC 20928 / JCM 3617 / NBRC 0987 / NRRL Y-1542) TaxID=983966 RepID=A0A0H5CAK5_CYBJN|nr:unnamed protein product [Cyberlindnera jadinii]
METLIDNLYQRVPLCQLQVPDEVDSLELLPVLKEISASNPHYVKQFMSQSLFKRLSEEDQDEYYELFGEIVMCKPHLATDLDLIRYNINNGTHVYIREAPRVISGSGTTGLRTWEAALFMSNWLLSTYSQELVGKRVLELGTGTGLVSLALLKDRTEVSSLTITDGDSNLIDSLSTNFKLNEIPYPSPRINCHSLWWGQDDVPSSDVILAADVTYDSSVIPSLVQCISDGFRNGAEIALVAATVRNEETLRAFEEELNAQRIRWSIVEECKDPSQLAQTVWYPKVSPEIKLYGLYNDK